LKSLNNRDEATKKIIVAVLIMAFITASYHGSKIGRFYSKGKRLLGLY